MREDNLIRLENLSKFYASEERVVSVINNISATFHVGEFVAITGESGCGKTTLLNMISGSIPMDNGEVYYRGEKISEYTKEKWDAFRKNEIGYIAQDNKLIPHYTTLQNIESAMLIQGKSSSEARTKARELLDLVGLREYEQYKACKLSAGQRQRLAIARILVKDTKVILADEPTANLDQETGRQIVNLLKQVSANRLILMVTHNTAQAEEFATRNIRLHGGTIEYDKKLRDQEVSTAQSEQVNEVEKVHTGKKSAYTGTFAGWNIKSGLGRSILISVFLVLMGTMMFTFFALFFANVDDIYTKKYDASAYPNVCDKRLVIRCKDDTEITEKNLEEIKQLSHVTSVDKYDCINDIGVYWEEGKDFKYRYEGTYRDMKILATNHYMRSISSISESDLSYGALPQKRTDIVISSNDSKLIGSNQIVYFTVPTIGADTYCTQSCTVTGLVKGNTGQIYFSDEESDMFNALYSGITSKVYYDWSNDKNDYMNQSDIQPVINDTLSGNQIARPQLYSWSLAHKPEGNCKVETTSCEVPGLSEPITKAYDVVVNKKEYQFDELYILDLDNTGKLYRVEDPNEPLGPNATVNRNDATYPYVDVSKDFFWQIYKHGSRQMTAYIQDYVYTDQVIDEIGQLGNYEVVSSFRISCNGYVKEKVSQRTRLIILVISFLGVITFATIFLINLFFGLRKKDYEVMKHLGMGRHHMRKIIVTEMNLYIIFSFIFLIAGVVAVNIIRPVEIMQYIKYFFAKEYIICAVFYLCVTELSGICFYHSLTKKIFRGRDSQ